MPLRCDHRLLGLQIIKSRQDLAVGAVRTIAFPVHTVGDNRTEGMPLVTEPPHAAIGICAHRLRRQRTVLFPIPLFSKLRMQRSEIIESGQDLLSRAERTPPPDLLVCSRHDLRRQQRRILVRVPLRKQIRKFCRQRVFLRQNSAARADGTARSPHADSDFGTIGMALGASPPYLLVASVGHILRRERSIAFIVPLCQQVSLFMPGAEIVQRRTDCRSPPAE